MDRNQAVQRLTSDTADNMPTNSDQLYRIPDDSEVKSVFEDSVKACSGKVAWLCPTLAHAEFKSADDYLVFELIRRGVRAPNGGAKILAYTTEIPADIQRLQSEPPVVGSAIGSANHRLCKLCRHCPLDNMPPTYLVNAWCYMFMSGEHVDKQGYCGQFRLRPDSPNVPGSATDVRRMTQ